MVKRLAEQLVLLIAEDDPDHRFFLEEALEEYPLAEVISFVANGQELMDYLLLKGDFTIQNAPRPNLILLDLNMPKKDGRQALSEIKQNEDLKHIPVVAFTTSSAKEDILKSYKAGASGFITKPAGFKGLVGMLEKLSLYWRQTVVLP